MKKLLIVITLIIFMIMFYHGRVLYRYSGHGIVELEFASKETGALIVACWNSTQYGDSTLLSLAKHDTRLDFVFILIYVTLIMTLSNSRMQKEKVLWLNELLRLNLFLAFSIGALDVAENIRLLHSFHHPGNVAGFWSTYFLALPKFILLFWVTLIYVISGIKYWFTNEH